MSNEFIAFPGLNLEFHISPIIAEFKLFGIQFAIKWYGLIIAIGFLLAVIYALKRAKHFKIDPDGMIDVALVSALFAFIGARLYFVLFSTDRSYYFKNPFSILEVWKGGLAIYGGIIFAFITAIWMCRVRKVNLWAMFDIGSLGFLIGQGIGRWGNFFNQEAYGANTTLPWGMTGSIIQTGDNGIVENQLQTVHPTFLYESLWCLLGLVILHIVSKKAYRFKGQIFSLYIMWYGAGRCIIEGLRADSLYLGAIRVSQLVAALSVIGGAILFFILKARNNTLPKDLFAKQTPDGDTQINEETGTVPQENTDNTTLSENENTASETQTDISSTSIEEQTDTNTPTDTNL